MPSCWINYFICTIASGNHHKCSVHFSMWLVWGVGEKSAVWNRHRQHSEQRLERAAEPDQSFDEDEGEVCSSHTCSNLSVFSISSSRSSVIVAFPRVCVHLLIDSWLQSHSGLLKYQSRASGFPHRPRAPHCLSAYGSAGQPHPPIHCQLIVLAFSLGFSITRSFDELTWHFLGCCTCCY